VLLAEKLAALTVHTRTRKEMSKVPARWERLQRIVELRNEISPETKIIGNGDVLSIADAETKVRESGVDGAMVGRALFGNPWFFHPTRRLPTRLTALPTHGVNRDTIMTTDTTDTDIEYVTLEERLRVLVEHTYLFCELLPHKNFAVMKKHYKAYVGGFPGAVPFRIKLMEAETSEAVEQLVHNFLAS
jgi:tRNA-dihydrouridine synthase